MPPSILEQVRAIASDILSVPADRMHPDSSPETIEAWDSIQHLNLVLALEENFNVQLSPEEIEQMRSIGQISTLIGSKLQTSAS
ncbi:MAG TPA: acyl carrier protein [Terriglobales bacterium]